MDDKIVDLAPHEWRSERPKSREPIFGPGLPGALAYIVGFAITLTITHWLWH
jgi:hypothetical protein